MRKDFIQSAEYKIRGNEEYIRVQCMDEREGRQSLEVALAVIESIKENKIVEIN